jgi:protein-S-isoprenylcysteine O-methyltransferase Ste14
LTTSSSLNRRAAKALVGFIAVLASLILIPAWTVRYWQAWLHLATFAACCAAITIELARRDPALLERRLVAGPAAEKEPAQQRIQTVTSVTLCLTYVVAGFDHRWEWSTRATPTVVVVADLFCVAAFLLIHATFRANTHTAGTVRVVEGQSVVSSGPYAVIRHPMYAAASLLFLATPLALGSFWAVIPAVALCAAIVIRLLDEERFLIVHLAGYDAYRRRVRFRLIPGVW